MKWDDVRERLQSAGMNPIEDMYMENYGKVLSSERAEFRGRYFKCTYGVVRCNGVRLEVFVFPSEIHRDEFLEVIGDDPWYVPSGNAVLHFPECDPIVVDNILAALAAAPR
jgi:hypothetical protein